LDLYAGGGLGFHIVSAKAQPQTDFVGDGHAGASGLFLVPFAGLRYYLSPKVALSLRLLVGFIGDWSGAEAFAGVTFLMK
jgi:hypothetical protein